MRGKNEKNNRRGFRFYQSVFSQTFQKCAGLLSRDGKNIIGVLNGENFWLCKKFLDSKLSLVVSFFRLGATVRLSLMFWFVKKPPSGKLENYVFITK